MLVKFWKGWITSEKMENLNWLDHWKKSAKETEDEKMQLVVFKIPVNKFGIADPETIEQIETLLQQKFK